MKMTRRKCFVKNCENNSKGKGKTIFRFPKGKSTFICVDHVPKNAIKKNKINNYDEVKDYLEKLNIITPPSNDCIVMKKYVSRKCFVKTCDKTNLSKPKVLFHKFPDKDSCMYKYWCEACQLSKYEESIILKFICENHFDSSR